MKKVKRILSVIVLSVIGFASVSAQGFDTGLDIYSSYIWRGAKFGDGAAFQPWVEYSTGDLAIGAWGSVNSGSTEALEMDLYVSYSIGSLSIGVTDYYFGSVDGSQIGTDEDGAPVFEEVGFFSYDYAHYIEPIIGYEVGDLALTAAYMFAPGFEDGDMYFEAAYSFGDFDLTVGAGDGAYTSDGEFSVCNIAIGTSKEVKITDSFSLPLSGAVVLNPSTEGFYITVGLSL